MTKQGYETYKMYLAMQRHFSTSYDFFKYHGKVKASVETYQKRSDVFSFEKLCNLVDQDDLHDFFLAHFVENPKCWIRDMNVQNLQPFKDKFKRMKTFFKTDLETIKNEGPARMVSAKKNEIPLIHKKLMEKSINIESVVILDSIFPFIDNHSDVVEVPVVFPDHIIMLQKYRPFVMQKINEDHDLYVDIARSVLKS